MAAQYQAFGKLQQYATKVKGIGYDIESADGELAYEARLSKTLKNLQDQVKQQEAALEKVALPWQLCLDHRLNWGS